jgi:uncharacterized protein DUF3601
LPGGEGEDYAFVMHGPCPAGHWTSALVPAPWRQLVPGERYRVTRAFLDFDGHAHEIGESWIFLARNFSPRDDGLSLFVSLDGMSEWHIRLRWTPEDQGAIIDALEAHLAPAQGPDGP